MLLPGPEAMQLATYAGWRVAGVAGGLIGGLLFVIPGALVILALAALYTAYGGVPLAEALFLGIKATVIVIVAQALLRVSGKALKGPLAWGLAVGAFLGLFVLQLPFPLIVIGAGLIGYVAANAVEYAHTRPERPAWPKRAAPSRSGLRSGSCRWPRSGSSRPAGSWPRWAFSSPSSRS
jgi:chromate transporter